MRLNRLDLNLIVCLDALLTERSVSRAAQRVFLSQLAMSVALRKLREHFGDEMVIRTGRSLRLTAFAESLQKPVRDAILQMQAISAWKPSFDPARSQRKITIEASDYATSVFMVRVFELAYRCGPHVQFDLRLLSSSYLEHLDSGALDVLIIPEAIASGSHPRERLFTDDFSCVVWKENPLVGKEISMEQYLHLGHVVAQWGGGRVSALDEDFLAHSAYTRRKEITAPSFNLMPQLVVGTNRVATVQTRLARQMAAHWPLKVLECPIEIPPIVETVQWHRYQERDPAILWFLGILRAVALQFVSAGLGDGRTSRGAPSLSRTSPRQ
jgi:LysR family nod box-dependent transcriptional activator